MMAKKFLYGGYIDYPGKGIIYDEDVYKLILKHSRFIDRLSRSKMVEMSILGQTILMGICKDVDPYDLSWTFYGKNSLYEKGL